MAAVGEQGLDRLCNIAPPHAALLFLPPGRSEALRGNGTARISALPSMGERHVVAGQTPAGGLVIRVTSVFVQCARAVMCSQLWEVGAYR